MQCGNVQIQEGKQVKNMSLKQKYIRADDFFDVFLLAWKLLGIFGCFAWRISNSIIRLSEQLVNNFITVFV